MVKPLTQDEVDSKTDPSVSKQWDETTPIEEQFKDLYKIVDGLKGGLLTTIRPGVGPTSRAMAVAKRVGPDFLFLANKDSEKFSDLKNDKTAQVTFQNSSDMSWVSVSGEAVTTSNDDPRIKQVYSKGVNAWFGDLGDGVHTGMPEDPRMTLIEVKANYITYWKSTSTFPGFIKEVAHASMTGQVADTGINRRLTDKDIQNARDSGL
ncbi:MAG: hypothetical protein L6R38_005108 [Xanthoria sp. 2 TBL-2021]|nr:MAG: hypothetical protein L6R38_005108 [Xanthoria sp. 2 TBL-2021]